MLRKLRMEYLGARNHVLSRGDRREDSFLDDVDRQDFLKTLAEACQKTAWQVQAYCRMRNPYHLVVETPGANLVAGMRWLQSTYSISPAGIEPERPGDPSQKRSCQVGSGGPVEKGDDAFNQRDCLTGASGQSQRSEQ